MHIKKHKRIYPIFIFNNIRNSVEDKQKQLAWNSVIEMNIRRNIRKAKLKAVN